MARYNKPFRLSSFMMMLLIFVVTQAAFLAPFPFMVKAQHTHPSISMASALERADRLLDPWTRMLHELNDDFFRIPGALSPQWRRTGDLTTGSLSTFKVDVTESPDAFVIKCELPGVNREDIKVTMDKGNLIIQGERKDMKDKEEGEGEKQVHIREFSYGKLYRSFRLPANADADHIDASYNQGVLMLNLPKMEAPQEKVIEVKAM